jgi:hypothetical protein
MTSILSATEEQHYQSSSSSSSMKISTTIAAQPKISAPPLQPDAQALQSSAIRGGISSLDVRKMLVATGLDVLSAA